MRAGNWSKDTALVIPFSSIFLESVAALFGKTTRMGRGFLATLTCITDTRRRQRGNWMCVCRNDEYEEKQAELTFELCSS